MFRAVSARRKACGEKAANGRRKTPDRRQAYLGKRISRAQNEANCTRTTLNAPVRPEDPFSRHASAMRVIHSVSAAGGDLSNVPANPGNTTGLSQPSALTADTPK